MSTESSPPEMTVTQKTSSPLEMTVTQKKSSSGTNYFDIIHTPDLPEDVLKHKKDLALILPLDVFMPIEWDSASVEVQQENNPRKYLGVDAFVDNLVGDARSKAEALIEDYQKDLVPLGEEMLTEVRAGIRLALREARSEGRISAANMRSRAADDPVRLNPFKLLIAARAFEATGITEPEYRDYFDVLIDKIALAAFLEFLLGEGWPKTITDHTKENPLPADEFDKLLLEALRGQKPLTAATNKDILNPQPITLAHDSWESILAHCLVPNMGEGESVVLTLDDLDHIVTEHLHAQFPGFRNRVPDGDRIIIDSWRKSGIGGWDMRRADHGLFYPVIDKFLEDRVGQQLFKLQFRSSAPLVMPFIEEIDMRPAVWAREATLITTEMYIATSRYAYLKARFDSIALPDDSQKSKTPELESLAEELRRASKLWFESKRQLELLEDEVANEGYNLTLDSEKAGPTGANLGRFYTLTRTAQRTKQVRVRKSRQEAYTVQERHTQCTDVRLPLPFFRIRLKRVCRDYYRNRRKHRTVHYYVTEKHGYTVEEKVEVDYDPIQDYLSRHVAREAFGESGDDARDARAVEFAKGIGREGFDPAKEEEGHKPPRFYVDLFNKDKKAHVFNVVLGEYVDQDGMTLDSVLKEIENRDPFGGVGLSERFQRILFIPVTKKRLNGEIQTVKYLAIHNPVLGRNSVLAPVVHIKETYRQGIQQLPGHWLGALSHTVCLFPGESRRAKLVSESRFMTEQKREQRTSQRSSMSRSVRVSDKVQTELSQRQSKSKSSNWHAKVSGSASYGSYKIAAEAGAGGQSSSSSESIARNLNEQTSEIMNDVSSSNEVQLLTSTDVKESHSTVSEQLVEFKNVNQGRAVNYKFFQIMHGFESSVSLHDVKIIVEYADELIPGANIQRTEEYRLDEIESVLPELIEEERAALVEALHAEVKNRYGPKNIKMANGELREETFLEKGVDGRVTGIKAENKLAEEICYVNSGAVFVDTEVGHLPATEDYVEDARERELAMQDANTKRVLAEATALERGTVVIPGSTNNLTVQLGQVEIAHGVGEPQDDSE